MTLAPVSLVTDPVGDCDGGSKKDLGIRSPVSEGETETEREKGGRDLVTVVSSTCDLWSPTVPLVPCPSLP